MNEHDESLSVNYPLGRGYGHDYMRGGEVLGGYGYAEREEYAKRRGELTGVDDAQEEASADGGSDTEQDEQRDA
jgi:hypothetical protein